MRTVQIIGRRSARVASRSKPGEFYAVDLDGRHGEGACTCKGFSYRGHCSHLDEVLKMTMTGEIAVDPVTLEFNVWRLMGSREGSRSEH